MPPRRPLLKLHTPCGGWGWGYNLVIMTKVSIPKEERIQFFVHIIESPNPPDVYHKRFEGDALQKILSLDSIHSSHRLTVNKEAFEAAFKVGLIEEIKKYNNCFPVIHISAHGNPDGIKLTSDEIITWIDLKNILLPINKALQESAHSPVFLLCMSSCEGFHAFEIFMDDDKYLPCFAIVGAIGKPTWSDTLIAFSSFYHLISKGCTITDAVEGMKHASAVDDFNYIASKDIKDLYIKWKASRNIGNLIAREMRGNPPSQTAIELEKTV